MALELLVLAKPMVAATQLSSSQSARLAQSASLFRKAPTFQEWPLTIGGFDDTVSHSGRRRRQKAGAFLWHHRCLISAIRVCVGHNNASASASSSQSSLVH